MITYYKVGGCVRDELLGVRSKDIDFAVEADNYEEMRDDILAQGAVIFQERPEFFFIRARHPLHGPADFTLCRVDGFYSDARHPDNVTVGSIYTDLARRDFTVNAIAEHLDGGYLIDPHGGITDLQNNLLRCVGDPYDRFTEDPLRILRAVRFHIVRGFKLHEDVELTLQNSWTVLNMLRDLPRERIYEELRKCYEHDTWTTLQFFRKHPLMENILFYNHIGLAPQI